MFETYPHESIFLLIFLYLFIPFLYVLLLFILYIEVLNFVDDCIYRIYPNKCLYSNIETLFPDLKIKMMIIKISYYLINYGHMVVPYM